MLSVSTLRLTGAPNFRDLGGLPAGKARRVRPGILFRSESLDRLTDGDIAALSDAGIRLVCDLRAPEERQRYPNRVLQPAAAIFDAHPANDDPVAGSEWFVALEDEDLIAKFGTAYVHNIYSSLPAGSASTVRELIDRMLDGEVPAIVHCAAGKDRTGWVVAVLLLAIGVPLETVERDYMLTDRFHGREELTEYFVRSGREPVPPLIEILRVNTHRLHIALEAAGPFETYLSDSVGLDPERRAQLVELLTQPA
jgi:protein-tyrosine phosphatase